MLFSTFELSQVQKRLEGITPFWLKYFPRQMNSDREEILFDQVVDGTKILAPFVSPNVQGRIMRDRGYSVKSFKPAYLKPKHVVDPSRSLVRRAGEGIGGTLTPEQRYNAIVASNLQIQKLSIENRWEWMAAQAMQFGKVIVVGEDYPETEVDFGRDPSLTATLIGMAKWSESPSRPLDDIKMMRRRVHKLSSSRVHTLVFGLDAWDAFSSHPDVKDLLDSRYRGSETNFNRAIADGKEVDYMGAISGPNGGGLLHLYVYSETFRDENGGEKPLLKSNAVVGISDGMDGVRCFGAIMDKKSLVPQTIFPKMWDNEDPSVTYVMSQSAPLMVPVEPNAVFYMEVVDEETP